MIEPRSTRRTLLAAILLIALVLGTYWPVLQFGFLNWDDRLHLLDNPLFQPPRVENVRHYWTTPYLGLYIPLTYTAWTLIGSVSMSPAVFHGANLVLHIACVLLVFAIVRRLIGSTWPAILGAAVFAVHPLQVETVAWVSGFRDLLGALLMLVSVWLYMVHARRVESCHSERTHEGSRGSGASSTLEYIRHDEHPISGTQVERSRYTFELFLSILFFCFALLAKPSAVVTPLIILILGWLMGRPTRHLIIETAPMFVLAVACSTWTKLAQPSMYLEHTSVWVRPLVAGDAIAFYLLKLAWPVDLCFDYGRTPESVLRSGQASIAWMAPVCLALVCALTARRQRFGTAAGLIFVAGVLPVLGFVPFDFQDKSTVADRYVYVSMLGIALAVAFIVRQRNSKRFSAVCSAAILALAVTSWVQIWTWRDTKSLATHALALNPRSFTALDLLAWEAFDDKNNPLAERLSRESLQIKDDNPTALINFGRALAFQGRLKEAVWPTERAVELRPKDAEAHANLGSVYHALHRYDDALKECDEALRLNPRHRAAKMIRDWAIEGQKRAAATRPSG